jgi:tetratricopeptide (TPR) repeat protein
LTVSHYLSTYIDSVSLSQESFLMYNNVGPLFVHDCPVGSMLLNMTSLSITQDNGDDAVHNLNEAFDVVRFIHGEKSPETAWALKLLARIYMKQGEFTESIKLYKKSIRYIARMLGGNHKYLAGAYRDMAVCQEHLGDLDGALASVHREREIVDTWQKAAAVAHILDW